MNNKEFIAELSDRMGYTAKDTQYLVNHIVNAMSDTFQEGDSVHVTGFGTFETKKKLERIITNPATGQRMLVPPKIVLSFKPIQQWKEKLKGGNGA